MLGFVIERLIGLIVVVFVALTCVFIVLHVSPGDPVAQMIPPEAGQEQVEQMREELGLNDPLAVQYRNFLVRGLQGDFGKSYFYQRPVLGIVMRTIPATMQLTFASLLLAALVGVPLGVISAVYRGSILDHLCSIAALVGQSAPTFWTGLLFILFFSVELRLLPTSGSGSIKHLILPSITLGAFATARITRLVRSSMLDVLDQDYVMTARSKGLSEITVVIKHAFRNASIAAVTVFGLTFGTLLGGAVITERVFAWPGVGRLLVDSILRRDYPTIQASIFYIAIIFVAINFIVDLSYTFLNPRIRLGRKK